MKRTLSFIFLFLAMPLLYSQASYSKETLEKIKAVENGLAGHFKIEGQPSHNIEDRMKKFKIKGLSVAVVHNYQVVWAKGYGWANEDKKKPVTTETLFEPGSISKSLNAIGALKLVQDKKMDLYADINTILTSWKFPYDSVSKNKKISLAQLLSHSAGLTVHGFPGYDLHSKIPTLPQVLNGEPPANSPAVRSQFEPGLRFEYSGGGTTISQLMIADVTKQAYDVFMYDNVLKPMGMVNSFYTQPPAKDKRHLCANGYHGDGSPVEHQFHVYPEQGAAGLWMTPSDLCNYIIETQLAYEGKSAKVLNQEMTRLRLAPYNHESAALGVFIEKHGTSTYFGHDAGNEGFSGSYYGSLEGGNGVAIFANSENGGTIFQETINSVASAYGWKDFYAPEYKKDIVVPETILQSYTGLYLFGGRWASVLKKDGDYYIYSDELYCRMHFSSPDVFFNTEFPLEKQFVKDTQGNVTGLRRADGKDLRPALKITRPDTLNLSKDELNEIGWHLLENKMPVEAAKYLNRGLQLKPGDLILLGNLAHAHLFNNNYKDAMEIYKAHLKETVEANFTWVEMIKDDFLFFKRHGLDTAPMTKVLAELKIKAPAGF